MERGEVGLRVGKWGRRCGQGYFENLGKGVFEGVSMCNWRSKTKYYILWL